ncbi:MAG: HD domain-containing protein [Lachnospiraceae bacterium]|nr:HD domain-containing protein [Lachnospiraceae bacterium]
MKKCSVNDMKGGEILANPIMTSEYQILLEEGTVLKKEYIEKIAELGITHVFVKEDKAIRKPEEIYAVKKEVHQKFKNEVKNVLEKHIYQENGELQRLSDAALNIIDDILKEEVVIEEMIELKDRSADLYEHSVSCCSLSTILGLRLKFEQKIIHAITVGALLHDIGLRFIPVRYDIDIESMPENQKTEYKKHSVYGYSSIEKETWLDKVSKNIILSHHERADGSGYPFRRRDIPKEISVVSVCDAFDEMICGIGCRRVKTYKAIEYLKFFKNIKFDGTIVDEFLKIIAAYPTGSQVLLNTGEIAVVTGQNKGFPERPLLRIVKDQYKMPLFKEKAIDLLKENSIFIEDVLN